MNDNKLPEKYVITIGRQMGSGGRIVGRMLAERLGIPFYDKELLMQAAVDAGLSPEFFERNDEKRPSYLAAPLTFSFGTGHLGWYDCCSNDDALYTAQCDFIRQIADNGPCVIVGRSADYVLRDRDNVVNIFVHADIDDCVRRVIERNPQFTAEQARTFVEKSNKSRAAFYNFYTEKKWGHATSYDLCLSSSVLAIDDIVGLTVEYLHRRFGKTTADNK